jgi:hypothetical protein
MKNIQWVWKYIHNDPPSLIYQKSAKDRRVADIRRVEGSRRAKNPSNEDQLLTVAQRSLGVELTEWQRQKGEPFRVVDWSDRLLQALLDKKDQKKASFREGRGGPS